MNTARKCTQWFETFQDSGTFSGLLLHQIAPNDPGLSRGVVI